MGNEVLEYQQKAREFIANCPEYPLDKYQGRGVVIPAGGLTYFLGMWVTVKMLREMGCMLPVEVWYLGEFEMDHRMRKIAHEQLGVECIDAYAFAQNLPDHQWSTTPGWELNPFCIVHSRFEEVLMLDADNVPIRDPGYLFGTPQYKEHGALFWPDYQELAPDREIWRVYQVPYRKEPEFESGQIVVDKKRCWKELQLTLHYNRYSEFYYRFGWGDKETFHMAWRRLKREYGMTPYPIKRLPQGPGGAIGSRVMCQHDFDGQIVFQHRNLAKWKFNVVENPRIIGFEYEQTCLDFIKELHHFWDGKLLMRKPSTQKEKKAYKELVENQLYKYNRVGYDERRIEFRADQTIGMGKAGLEQYWEVREIDGKVCLIIAGNSTRTMDLYRGSQDGNWKGAWNVHEQMPITLIPATREKGRREDIEKKLLKRRYVCRRIRHDRRIIELEKDGTVMQGDKSTGQTWKLRLNETIPELLIYQPNGVYCVLREGHNGIWEGSWEAPERLAVELAPV